MNRLIISLLALSLSLVVLPACDGDDTEADDEAPAEEAADEEVAEEAQAQEAAGDDELIDGFADVFTSIITAFREASNYQCECAPEMMGFNSTEECMDAIDDEGAGLAEFRECVVTAMKSIDGEPSASTRQELECARGAVAEIDGCYESLRADHDDLCTEEAAAAFAACSEQIEKAFSACEAESDDQDDPWMDALDEGLQECMAQAMGF